MDSDVSSPTQENNEPKAEFRKITNEAANRKYRRRSPVSGSSGEDVSPKHDRSSGGVSKASNYERRNNDKDDKGSTRSQHDSYRHSSRGNRHDEHSRYGKHVDEDVRGHAKQSSRSGQGSRGGTYSDFRDQEGYYKRSRDRYRDVDRYPRDRSDRTRYEGRHGGRYDDRDRNYRDRDYRQDEKEYRSSRDYRGDRNENFNGNQSEHNPTKETGDVKDSDGSKYSQEKSKNDRLNGHGDRCGRAGGKSQDRSGFVSDDFSAKRPKVSLGSDAMKAEERQSSGEDLAAKVSPQQGPVSGADLVTSVDAAKVAAIRAAQLVNQNLTCTGFMTADQKKKLLWGSKKSTVTEETSHRWDTALFSDRDRQEKFNKLMGVKGEAKADSNPPSGQDTEKQRELQMDLEKQYTAGLRRRDGRTVGLGL